MKDVFIGVLTLGLLGVILENKTLKSENKELVKDYERAVKSELLYFDALVESEKTLIAINNANTRLGEELSDEIKAYETCRKQLRNQK